MNSRERTSFIQWNTICDSLECFFFCSVILAAFIDTSIAIFRCLLSVIINNYRAKKIEAYKLLLRPETGRMGEKISNSFRHLYFKNGELEILHQALKLKELLAKRQTLRELQSIHKGHGPQPWPTSKENDFRILKFPVTKFCIKLPKTDDAWSKLI